MQLTPGSRIGPYQVLAPLGTGGMGEVYRARDPRLGREVALKIVPASGEDQAGRFRRFEQEAMAVAALDHPHVLAVHDMGVESGVHYVVFELLEGQTLRDRLEQGPIPPRKALEYGVQIGRGLAAAHARGILHRDLKPENLFLTREGQIKILDFGLAKLTEASDADLPEAVTRTATEDGIALGTAGYMSPEQARGKRADARSDVFAMGAVLYEMLTGRRAFGGETTADRLSAILNHDPPELASAAREPVSPALDRIVRRCLEKDPEERFQTARDVAFALEAIGSSSARDKVADAPPPPGRRIWRRAAAALVMAGIAAAGVLAGRGLFDRPVPAIKQLTFRRGTVTGARFAPDGQTIAYSASWDGKPNEVFMTRLDSQESRSLGLPPAKLLSVSSSGELAILLTRAGEVGDPFVGTLARVALAGGVPRQVLEEVEDADWSPDGQELAVVRLVNGVRQLEYPVGKVLWRSIGRPGTHGLRVSPRGDKVALLMDGLTIVERSGGRRSFAIGDQVSGISWAPGGDTVWVTMTGKDRAIWRFGLDGSRRLIYRAPGTCVLHDIAKSGAVLLHHGFERFGSRVKPPGETVERELASPVNSTVQDISADGGYVILADELNLFRCPARGGEPTLLARGTGGNLSPDGKWVALWPPGPDNVLSLVATGPGEPRHLPLGKLQLRESSFLDANRVLLWAAEPGASIRGWVQEIATGAIRPVTPEGVEPWRSPMVKDAVLARQADGTLTWFPLTGEEPRPTRASVPEGSYCIRTTPDGKWTFVSTLGVPTQIDRIDLLTGRRNLWKSVAPPDLTGVVFMHPWVRTTPDGEAYVYTYLRVFQDLFLVEGLR